jgi:hypothetical protein
MVQGEHGHRGVKRAVGEGQLLGRALHGGAAPGGRCARITADGSTAVTSRSDGS